MTKHELLLEFGELIRKAAELKAKLTMEGMLPAAQSLYTTEQDLIWQYKQISEFEE